MKDFLKMTLATLVGLFLFGLVSFFISLGMIGAIAAMSDTTTTVNKNSVFKLELNGELIERSNDDSFASVMAMIDDSRQQLGLDEILLAIKNAKNCNKVKGIYLNIKSFAAAPASVCEIIDALKAFKESGKFVVAYADSYSNLTYALACVADKVVLNPYGTLGLTGLSSNVMFYKGALDKLGVEMQVFKVGTFKSAVEPFVNTKMSDANRLQLTQLNKSLWTDMLKHMADGRGIDAAKFDQFANEGGFFKEAKLAQQRKLVDTLAYECDMEAIITDLAGDELKTVSLKTMKNIESKDKYSSNKVAVLYATGDIDGNSETSMNSEKITKELLKLADDDDVKAVVMRVNSPGGSAFGSEQMWHATQVVKAKKPFVVSMGDYAASGGYYISCGADAIVAQPTTITGSIGIFGLLPNVEKLTQNIGLSFDGVKTNEFADFGMPYRPANAAERALFQNNIERGYELFVGRCAAGRHVSADSIKQIAEGRVWTGSDALTIGLVDTLGTLNDAIALAAQRAGLDEYNVKEVPAKQSLMEQLMSDFTENIEMRILQQRLGANYAYYQQLQDIVAHQGIQAIMPFYVTVE